MDIFLSRMKSAYAWTEKGCSNQSRCASQQMDNSTSSKIPIRDVHRLIVVCDIKSLSQPSLRNLLHAKCVTTGYTKPSNEYIGNVMAHFSGICYWLHSFLQHSLYFAPRAVIFSHLKRMPLCLRVCDIAIVMCRKVVRTYLSSFDFCAALKDF